jgi:plastocyanin
MKRLYGLCWKFLVCAILLFPSVSVANRDVPAVGVPAVDISFEATAPYYQPQVAIAPAGVPVRWSNPTASPHSIRHDGCLTGGFCAFQSLAVFPDDSFIVGPLPPGRYPYHCELHPVMRGTLLVIESQARSEKTRALVDSMR